MKTIVVPYADGEERLKETYAKWVNYATPEGMARLARQEKEASEKAVDADRTVVQDEAFVKSGWGKANPNIDWVDSSKKKNYMKFATAFLIFRNMVFLLRA